MNLPDEARALIASGAIGHLATIDTDGKPHVTCAWVGVEGDELVIGTIPDQRKLCNIRRDPRVTISFETKSTNQWGLLEYLVIEGHARVTEGGAAELLQTLAEIYIGPGVKFPPMEDPPPGFVTRITPQRISGVGPWSAHR